MIVTVCVVMAAQAAIAEGTAVEALAAFEGESVVIETRDGRKVVGLLKKVSGAAIVVLSPWDGTVVSLRPADVVGFRIATAAPGAASPPSMATPTPTPPAVEAPAPDAVVVISPTLKARSQPGGSILLYPAMRMDERCQYLLDNEAGAVRLEYVTGPTPALVFPASAPLEPERKNRILGCDEALPVAGADIRYLTQLRPTERVKRERQRHLREERNTTTSARASRAAVERSQADKLLDDAEWDRNAALAIGLGGVVVTSVGSLGGVLVNNPQVPQTVGIAQGLLLGSAVAGTVTTIASGGFALKAIFEYADYERETR